MGASGAGGRGPAAHALARGRRAAARGIRGPRPPVRGDRARRSRRDRPGRPGHRHRPRVAAQRHGDGDHRACAGAALRDGCSSRTIRGRASHRERAFRRARCSSTRWRSSPSSNSWRRWNPHWRRSRCRLGTFRRPDAALGHLTRTQLDVLRCIALGWSNAEIARRRASSLRSVEKMVTRTFDALGVTTTPTSTRGSRQRSCTSAASDCRRSPIDSSVSVAGAHRRQLRRHPRSWILTAPFAVTVMGSYITARSPGTGRPTSVSRSWCT